MLLRGHHSLLNGNIYWSTGEDHQIRIVSTVMWQNKFKKIKHFFHIVDNTRISFEDKLAKIGPCYEHLSKNLLNLMFAIKVLVSMNR